MQHPCGVVSNYNTSLVSTPATKLFSVLEGMIVSRGGDVESGPPSILCCAELLMKQAVNVAITGAAGQIGYALAFRVASGQMFGPDQPVNLALLEIPQALPGLQGVVMELDDCAFPTLNKVLATDDAKVAFKDCHA